LEILNNTSTVSSYPSLLTIKDVNSTSKSWKCHTITYLTIQRFYLHPRLSTSTRPMIKRKKKRRTLWTLHALPLLRNSRVASHIVIVSIFFPCSLYISATYVISFHLNIMYTLMGIYTFL